MKIGKKSSAAAPMAASSPETTSSWRLPTGAFDLLGDRFRVRGRARTVVLSLAGGAFVAALLLALQVVVARVELAQLEKSEKTALDRRAALSAEVQGVLGGSGLTEEQLENQLAVRRSTAEAVGSWDPAIDGLVEYLTGALSADTTLSAIEVKPASSGSSSTPSGPRPAASPPGSWKVTVTVNAPGLDSVARFEQVLAAAPMLGQVSVTWSDGSPVRITGHADLTPDPTRVATINAQLEGSS